MASPMYDSIEYAADLCAGALDLMDPKPFVAVGGSSVEKPFMCHVGELPLNVQVTDPVTADSAYMGRVARGMYRVEYSIPLTLWAARQDLVSTSRMLVSWWEAIARAVASDKTLGGTVEHAQPYWSASWSQRNQNGAYLVAMEGGISVRRDIDPYKEA